MIPWVSHGRAPPPDAAGAAVGLAVPKDRLAADESAAAEDAAAGGETPNEGAAEEAGPVDDFAVPKPPKPPPKPGVEPEAAAGANPKVGAAFFSSFAGAAAVPLLSSALVAAAGGGAPKDMPPPVDAGFGVAAAPKMPPIPPNTGFAAADVPGDAAGAAPNAGAGACECEGIQWATALSRHVPKMARAGSDTCRMARRGQGAYVPMGLQGCIVDVQSMSGGCFKCVLEGYWGIEEGPWRVEGIPDPLR